MQQGPGGSFHPWKHCSGGLAVFEAINDTWHMCMCSLGFLDFNLGRHKNVIKPPKQMIRFNYFELMDVVLVTWQTFSQSMKERQLGYQSRCMWVARKKVGNANGGSEFDFRLADGGRGWTMVPSKQTAVGRFRQQTLVYENRLKLLALIGLQFKSFNPGSLAQGFIHFCWFFQNQNTIRKLNTGITVYVQYMETVANIIWYQ